jgi:uncharacterized protein
MNNRYVFDTNVLVSALYFEHSISAQAFFLASKNGVVLASIATLHEAQEVLARKKFASYLSVEEREQFVSQLILRAELIDVIETIQECRDPKDNKFLEVAVNGSANFIVTGDADLLILHPFRGISIIQPAVFLALHHED